MRPAIALVVAISMLAVHRAAAQEGEAAGDSSSIVGVAGSVTLTGDVYDFSSQGTIPVGSRRPPTLFRTILNPVVTVGNAISLPFTIMFSSRETSTITPPIANQTPSQFLLNAANSFGVSPKIGWAEFHLGSHTPQFSELTAGDVQIFGLGFDLKPGNFRFAASAGIAQRAVETDTTAFTRGAYARYLYAASVGYMNGETEVALNLLRARDDPSSITELRERLVVAPDTADPTYRDTIYTRSPLMPLPEEGLVTTISARVPVAEGATISGEAGASLFTRDMLASTIGERAAALNSLVRQRTSSRVDGAGKLTATLQRETWGISATGLYIGPGYATLGYPYLQPDRLEFTVAPSVRLFENKLNVAATFGHRTNNLTQSEGATTTQILASANVNAELAEGLTLATGYTNFGITTDVTNDTFKIRSIAQSFNFTPAYVIAGEDLIHTISATLALDDYNDLNPISGAQSSNNTKSATVAYAIAFTGIPLSSDVNGTYLINDMPAGALSIESISVGFGYSFLNGALAPSFSVSYTGSRPEGATADTELGVRLAATWRITPKLRLNVTASVNSYDYGSAHPSGSFRENLLRTALSWRL
jgi:hypothetical protein